MAIEDPFDLSHNLGVGLSRNSKYFVIDHKSAEGFLREFKCLEFYIKILFWFAKA
jgi:hypothetical protein